MRRWQALWLALVCGSIPGMARGAPPLALGGDPRLDPADFAVTTYASALDYPLAATQLRDGSLLVGMSRGGSLFAGPHELVRLVDADSDGAADGAGTVLYSGLPRAAFGLARVDDLVVAVTAFSILLLRQGPSPTSALSLVGRIDLAYPVPWLHNGTSLVGVRRASTPPGRVEIFFNVGSQSNDVPSTGSVAATGLLDAALLPDSVHRVVIDLNGPAPAAIAVDRIAAGLRNAFAGGFDPVTGDLLLADNGIDSPSNSREPLSADELDAIGADAVGGAVEHFGFPSSYETYRTGTHVGSVGLLPYVAFQPSPMPDGAEAEGAASFAVAPFRFPSGLERGVFVGFHGQFERGGVDNEENPVVFVDRRDASYLHFVPGQQPGLGHPDGLVSTGDALFVIDTSTSGPLAGPASGAIYRVGLAGGCAALGGDADHDGICDAGTAACSCRSAELPDCVGGCADNCPLRVNPDQLDRTHDGVGDVCTCGDVDADGDVDSADSGAYRARLAGAPAPFSRDLCNLDAEPDCDLRDSVRLRRSLAGYAQGVAHPSACAAASLP